VIGVETNEGIYTCGQLVLTTGAWAAQLPRSLKIELPLQVGRSQVALFRRPVDSGRRGTVFADFGQGLYLRPAQGDFLHAGDLTPPTPDPRDNPDIYPEAADNDWLPAIRQRLIRRCPAMHRCFGRGGYALVTAQTSDGLPILDRLPDVEGVWCALGFARLGFLLAPVVGQVMTAWLMDGSASDVDVTPFRLARFTSEPAPSAKESA
jgi:glycine/D-amino acid oxidase-like deaminating enzyme